MVAVLIALNVNSAFYVFDTVVFSFSVHPAKTATSLTTYFAMMDDSSRELNNMLIDFVGRIA